MVVGFRLCGFGFGLYGAGREMGHREGLRGEIVGFFWKGRQMRDLAKK